MIRSPIPRPVVAVFTLSACLMTPSFNVYHAYSAQNANPMLPLTSALTRVPGEMSDMDRRTTVSWKGQDYSCDTGAHMLMELVVKPDTDRAIRAEALTALRRVPRPYLRDNDKIEQLMSVYENLQTAQEKVDLIIVVAAWSPRTLPFLVKILDRENDMGVRQQAAAGLAAWNVRRGVAELLHLLEECTDVGSADRIVCNEGAKTFLWLNARKGWGFPEKETRESIMEKADLDDNAKSALFVTEIKKWWAENEQRFPDWKPGDPLPAAAEGNESATPANP